MFFEIMGVTGIDWHCWW